MTHEKADYPAAHSMDTTWFAVDGNGEVGLFLPTLAGALPWAWLEVFHPGTLFGHTFAELLPTDEYGFSVIPMVDTTVLEGMADSFEEARDRFDLVLEPEPDTYQIDFTMESLMVLDAPMTYEELLPEHHGEWAYRLVFPDAKLFVVLWDMFPNARLEELMLDGRVVGFKPFLSADIDFEVEHHQYEVQHLAPLLRLHVFVEPWSNYSRPFEAVFSPEHPLMLDDLSDEGAHKLRQVQFDDVDFGEVGRLHPAELGPAGVWGIDWIDTSGRIWRLDDRWEVGKCFARVTPDDRGEFEGFETDEDEDE